MVKVGLAPKQQRPALMEYMEKYAGIVHGQDHGRVRWKSTWWRVKTHKGPPCSACRRSSHDVDAAGCKSVGDDGGTWDIFTNCHLFVCKRISAIYRPSVCCPRYSGEYRINCISLLILSIYGWISEWCEVKSSANRLNLRKGEVTPIKDTFIKFLC